MDLNNKFHFYNWLTGAMHLALDQFWKEIMGLHLI
jgi:hypothetical protein